MISHGIYTDGNGKKHLVPIEVDVNGRMVMSTTTTLEVDVGGLATDAKLDNLITLDGVAGDTPPTLPTNAAGKIGWLRKIVDTLAGILEVKQSITVTTLLNGVTADGVGSVVSSFPQGTRVFQVKLGGTSGTVSASVKLYATNDALCLTDQTGCAQKLLTTFVLSGTAGANADIAADTNFYEVTSPWKYYWMEVTGLTGTGAKVSGWGS
jgi:hypothetical protein